MATIKKYNGSTWENAVVRKYGTASEIITPPTTIYTDGTAISTYIIKGNTVQSGTPTPSNPVPVVGVGELETTGDHTGEYKIPISTVQTTNIYLGSVQSTRQIKKLVLTGDEDWNFTAGCAFLLNSDYLASNAILYMCTHYKSQEPVQSVTNVQADSIAFNPYVASRRIYIKDSTQTTQAAFIAYLQQQYTNGTPVTVYYVLATAETAAVNEPLMKIGDYADSISNAASIPTTDGANSITVDTTVQPSEFTATWTGWHNAYVKEKSENIYDKYSVMEIANLGTRYGQYVPEGVYSIYNDTDNTVYWGVQDMQSRFKACEPHSTATVDMSVQHGSPNYGFMMPYDDASLGDVSIVQGSTVPDHYIPYWE